jgi:phage terminase small subunit
MKTASKRDKALHQRRTRFIKEFLLDQNATRAAVAAGYSKKTAHVQGNRLLRNAYVRHSIETKNSRINAKLDITVERVKLELARLAFFDPLEFWNEDGTAKPLHEISEDARRALAGFEVAELFQGAGDTRGLAGYLKKFKLADKGANLERLGKHLQMFPTKVEISGDITLITSDDADINTRIAKLERDLGLAAAIDDAGRIASTQAGTRPTNGEAKTSDLLPR